jgi:hypothetical protein
MSEVTGDGRWVSQKCDALAFEGLAQVWVDEEAVDTE